MRFVPFVVVLVLAGVFVALGILVHPGWFWGLAVAGPLAALGLVDFFQPHDVLRRNYPLWIYGRYLLRILGPYLRTYVVEEDKEGKPYSRDERKMVYARADGTDDKMSFGSEFDFYAANYAWIQHSIAAREKAKEPFRITIGGAECRRPYSSSVLNISAMSFGSLGRNAVEALNLGARLGHFAHDTGEGGYSEYHRRHGGDIVWEVGTGYFGCRTNSGGFDAGKFADKASDPQVKMVELKLSQGAKPGHGGVLPAAKVTDEIAAAREVTAHVDCISPSHHTVFSTPIGLLEFVTQMRELSGGKPAGFKLCVGHPWEFLAVCKAMLKTGILPDFIVVDGAEGGTGAAPREFPDNVGTPLYEGLSFVRNALDGTGLRGRIRIGASGKVASGFSMAAVMALGADWCNAARAFMLSLGCVQSMRCHTGTCPTGITTHDPLRQRALVVPDRARRVAAFHAATLDKLAQIVAAAGLDHPGDLRPDHLYIRDGEARPASKVYPVLSDGVLLSEPNATPFAEAWRLADADSFAPRL